MITIGDKVLYKTNGVCTVDDICVESIPDPAAGPAGKSMRECFLLRPIHDTSIKLYVPTDRADLIAQIKPVLTADEAMALLDINNAKSMEWIEEMRPRTNAFRDLIASGDRENLLGMICLLYRQRESMHKLGRRLYANDETMLKKAEKLLFEEIAFVLNMSYNDVSQLYFSKIVPEAQEV